MKMNYLHSICLLCVFIWNKFDIFREKFRHVLDESDEKYNQAVYRVFNQICLILNTKELIDADQLTRRDKIIGGFKFVLLIVLADIFISTIFDSLYQVMVYTFNFYMIIPSLFYSVVGLAGVVSVFIPKRRFLINLEENVKTVSRVILTSVYISIFAANALMVQVFYTLGAIVKDPCIHNLVYVMSTNFFPCIVTVGVICMSKYSVCILSAIQKIKIELFWNQ